MDAPQMGEMVDAPLVWSICTQYRDYGCADLRIRRRLQIKVRLVTLDEPELLPKSRVAL